MSDNKAKVFNEKFAEYKAMIERGEMPDTIMMTQLLIMADSIIKESDDIAGPKETLDYGMLISQTGKNVGGALGGIQVSGKLADREAFINKYQDALDEEVKAKKNAAEIMATTVVGLATTALKVAL